jgi:hypothetical protein
MRLRIELELNGMQTNRGICLPGLAVRCFASGAARQRTRFTRIHVEIFTAT